jgi:hypothetical protein
LLSLGITTEECQDEQGGGVIEGEEELRRWLRLGLSDLNQPFPLTLSNDKCFT